MVVIKTQMPANHATLALDRRLDEPRLRFSALDQSIHPCPTQSHAQSVSNRSVVT